MADFQIIQGDCLEVLKHFEARSVDSITTDPPYGLQFMGKDWDRVVPSVAIWKECFRVLKDGAFAFIMCAPRLDVQSQMTIRLQDAGFDVGFTPIYWVFASGFPKSENIAKVVDKKLGVERDVTGIAKGMGKQNPEWNGTAQGRTRNSFKPEYDETVPRSPEAKALDGSYGGFQPKPAVEVIIVAMKPLEEVIRRTEVYQILQGKYDYFYNFDTTVPELTETNQKEVANLSEKLSDRFKITVEPKDRIQVRIALREGLKDECLKNGIAFKSEPFTNSNLSSFVVQALKNQKGITWLDEGRIPFERNEEVTPFQYKAKPEGYGYQDRGDEPREINEKGRFPANLLVSDDVLNDGVERHPAGNIQESNIGDYNASSYKMGIGLRNPNYYGDSGSFSRYFSLDAWYEKKIAELPEAVRKTFPFLIVPKASKEERNYGLEGFDEKERSYMSNANGTGETWHPTDDRTGKERDRFKVISRNMHPTVKPLQLMLYLVTLGSRAGEVVLDPFMGSGTTGIACKTLNRKFMGIELNPEYVKIAEARIKAEHQVALL